MISKMNIKIIIATHKNYKIPRDELYLPLQVGAELHPRLEYTGDNTGNNISRKNPNYCELTALYWAWKNSDADYIGLCHYRRYFAEKNSGDKWSRILTHETAAKLLEASDVILPRKRNYYIETNYSQYIHAHHKQDLDITREILSEKYPAYVPAFDNYMKQTKGHHFNMFVMRKDILSGYCEWLFDVLGELENRLDITDYSENDKRVFGFVSERLVDTWLDTNGITYTELPVINMEPTNWLVKGGKFLMRKINASRKPGCQ